MKDTPGNGVTPARLRAFITGASSGIGLALAEEYLRRGAVLGLVARRGDTLAAFAARFPSHSISIYPADVRDAAALAAAAAQFCAQHGGADVVFKRVPVAFRDDFIPHSKMYHALDALGLADKLTPAVFNEIHVKKNYLLTPEAQATFLATQGVDKKKYLDAYNSFSTQSDLQRDTKLMQDYKIDGVPTLAVQGKYETGPATTNSLPGTIQVLDFLVAQVRAKKM